MDSAGEPTLPFLRLSVDAKMHAASWKVRMISTTRAWPGVVLLLSCEPSRMTIINHRWEGAQVLCWWVWVGKAMHENPPRSPAQPWGIRCHAGHCSGSLLLSLKGKK